MMLSSRDAFGTPRGCGRSVRRGDLHHPDAWCSGLFESALTLRIRRRGAGYQAMRAARERRNVR
ncbi:hypothetical protein WS89_05765 [Burkholderia sp. MSMB1072]|nr:hypothetical protein WS89_05765 [Burkholderia sp. MSMB1072]